MTSYPRYPHRWRASMAVCSMTLEQQGLYVNLLDACWIEGCLPTDERALQRLGMATPAEWRRAWPVVRQQFFEADGRLRHLVVDQVRPTLEQAQRADEKKRAAVTEARRRGAAKTNAQRWSSEAVSDNGSDNGSDRSDPPERQAERPPERQLSDTGSDRSKSLRAQDLFPIPLTHTPRQSPPPPPLDTDSPTAERANALAEAAPPHRRDSADQIAQALIDHSQADDDGTVARYRAWVASEEWRRDGGRYAVSPVSWIRTGKWRREPLQAAESVGDPRLAALDPETRRAVELAERRAR